VSGYDLGLERSPDDEILKRARTDDAVVVTADHDVPRLVYLARNEFPGLLLLRLKVPSADESILRVRETLERLGTQEWRNRIVVVESDKIRINEVPLP